MASTDEGVDFFAHITEAEPTLLVAAQRCHDCGEHLKVVITDQETGTNVGVTLRTDDDGWDAYHSIIEYLPTAVADALEELG